MRKILSLFMLLWFVPNVFGQSIGYEYDASGNRTHRTIYLPSRQSSLENEIDAPQTRATITEEASMPKYEDFLGERKVVIYPNPTRGMIRIEFQGYGEMNNAQLLLYNMQGNLLRQVNNVESSATLDLTPYPAGMYILVLSEGKSRSQWRIIKQ